MFKKQKKYKDQPQIINIVPNFARYAPRLRFSYEFLACTLHQGESSKAGHYTSVVRNIKDGLWRRYNDNNVAISQSKTLVSSFFENGTPYICFYRSKKFALTENTPYNTNKISGSYSSFTSQNNIELINLCSDSDSDNKCLLFLLLKS